MFNPFSELIPDARQFLGDLAQNNTRDWFAERKPIFEEKLKIPATHLLDDVASGLGPAVRTKLFRQNRDIRFSKDKTPYNTHLHLSWQAPNGPGYFFGISPDYVKLGAGIMGFDKPALTKWRNAVGGPDGAGLNQMIDAAIADGFTLDAPALKRVPTPFASDHPRSELLRRKGLTLWRDIPASAWSDPTGALLTGFRALTPITDWLKSHV